MKPLTVFLVLAVLLIGLPISMGMGQMAYCPDCLEAGRSGWAGVCLAVITAGLFIVSLALMGRASFRTKGPHSLGVVATLDKPPRFA